MIARQRVYKSQMDKLCEALGRIVTDGSPLNRDAMRLAIRAAYSWPSDAAHSMIDQQVEAVCAIIEEDDGCACSDWETELREATI